MEGGYVVKRSILKFIIPVTFLKLSDRVFRLIYDMISSRIDNNIVLVTYGSISPILEITGTIISGLSFGGVVYYNTHKDKERAFSSSLYTMLLVVSALTMVLLLFDTRLLEILGVQTDLVSTSRLALRYTIYSLIFNSVISLISDILITEEMSKFCIAVNLVLRSFKVVLFLFADSLEDIVKIGFYCQVLNCLVILVLFYKVLGYKLVRVKIQSMIKIVLTGIPVMIYSSCYPAGNFALVRESNALGVSVLASASAISTIECIVYCFYDATWNVVSKYVGEFVRDKKLNKVKRFLMDLSVIILGYHIALIFILHTFKNQIYSIIGLNTDYFKTCSVMMSIYLFTCVLDAFADIIYASINTIKEVRLVSLIPLFTIGAVRVLYITYFYQRGSVSSLYMVYPVSYIVNLLAVIFIFFYFTRTRAEYSLNCSKDYIEGTL